MQFHGNKSYFSDRKECSQKWWVVWGLKTTCTVFRLKKKKKVVNTYKLEDCILKS